MAEAKKLPRLLYNYRGFSRRSRDILVANELYYWTEFKPMVVKYYLFSSISVESR